MFGEHLTQVRIAGQAGHRPSGDQGVVKGVTLAVDAQLGEQRKTHLKAALAEGLNLRFDNGPALFGELIGAYKAAIAIDPSNPRPVYLLARFNRDMAKFMGQTSPEFCKELLKAKELYEARKDKPFYPSWGKEEVTRLLLECDKQ